MRGIPLLLSLLLLAACGGGEPEESFRSGPRPARHLDAAYAGRSHCVECHSDLEKKHANEAHDLALQPAAPVNVDGDFDDAELVRDGRRFVFSRQEGRYLVEVEGPDGQRRKWEVVYAIGVQPFQQYLVDAGGGRWQALDVAWDNRPEEEGGQRWYALHGDSTDPPRWTTAPFDANRYCLPCHSTDLRINSTDGGYRTTWAEIDVSCEACHGPASGHLRWVRHGRFQGDKDPAKGHSVPLDRLDAAQRWEFDMEKGNAYRDERAPDRFAVDSCGRCHSAGENFADPRPDLLLTDYRRPTLLRAPHYFPDGQIRGEVYSWGSFLQSRMYHEGVVCSDCHDAHGLTTPGDLACAKCHLASEYQNRRHHGHKRGQGGDSCVDCHMPARTYWQVDVRHDHSLRIPRPDLSAKLGTPNTCTGCHKEKDDAWAMRAMDEWYGEQWRERPEWGTALAGKEPEALRTLLNDGELPAIVRATAAVLLAEEVGGAATADLDAVATDDPLLRQGLERARAVLD